MDFAQFWPLMDKTRIASGGDVNRQAKLLTEELVCLSVEEIVEYQRIFDRLDIRAERNDLQDVADFIYGGLGDDGWKDFIAWLIGQGQFVYENALADPETLVDVVTIEGRLKITAELLSYAGQKAYRQKMGDDTFIPYEPIDEPVSIVESLLKSRTSLEEYDQRFQEKFPRAWAKFSDWDFDITIIE